MRSIFLAISAFLLLATPAYALHQGDAPSAVIVTEVTGYTNLLQTGDALVLLRYNIIYSATTAEDNVDRTFIMRLEVGATTVAVNEPYPYFDSDGDGDSDGYGEGIASIYLTPAQTQAAGLTDANGAWGTYPPTNFNVVLEGNPAHPILLPYDTHAMTSGDFTGDETGDTNETALGNKVLQYANQLQAAWGTTLLAQGQNLLNDTDGSGYFTLAIPGLRQMTPKIFSIRTESPTIPTPSTSSGDFANAQDTQNINVQWWGKGFTSLASDTGLPAGSIEGGFVGVVSGFITVQLGKKYGARGAQLGLVFSAVMLLPVMMIATGWVAYAYGGVAILALGLAAILKTAKDVEG